MARYSLVCVALVSFSAIPSVATAQPQGFVSLIQQWVNNVETTTYLEGETLKGKAFARVRVVGAETPPTDFKLELTWLDSGSATVDDPEPHIEQDVDDNVYQVIDQQDTFPVAHRVGLDSIHI
jgi:hypothetical protein